MEGFVLSRCSKSMFVRIVCMSSVESAVARWLRDSGHLRVLHAKV